MNNDSSKYTIEGLADGTRRRVSTLCLGAVAEIAECVARGDEVLAGQARKRLNELCWSPDGYPTEVRDALRAAGLREVAT